MDIKILEKKLIDLENKKNKIGEQLLSLDSRSIVTFIVVNNYCGLFAENVVQIIKFENIVQLKAKHDYSLGLMVFRDQPIVVIDLAKRLGCSHDEKNLSKRVMVCETGQGLLGLVVDEIKSLVHVNLTNIKAPKNNSNKSIPLDYLEGIGHIGKEKILILDINRIIDFER